MKKKKKRKHYHHKKPRQPQIATRTALNPLQQRIAEINRLKPIMEAAQQAEARHREREKENQ